MSDLDLIDCPLWRARVMPEHCRRVLEGAAEGAITSPYSEVPGVVTRNLCREKCPLRKQILSGKVKPVHRAIPATPQKPSGRKPVENDPPPQPRPPSTTATTRRRPMKETKNVPLCKKCGQPAVVRKDGQSLGRCKDCVTEANRKNGVKRTLNPKRLPPHILLLDFTGEAEIQTWLERSAKRQRRTLNDQALYILDVARSNDPEA